MQLLQEASRADRTEQELAKYVVLCLIQSDDVCCRRMVGLVEATRSQLETQARMLVQSPQLLRSFFHSLRLPLIQVC